MPSRIVPRCLDILILEDRAEDAELLVAQLRREGFAPTWTRVHTEAAFEAALRSDLDLILADYSLPQFTGRRALEIVGARQLDIPVIVVTGAVGEELAVECLRAGAADYLLKDRLARLGSAVANALAERARRVDTRRVEAALRASELQYRRLFECSQDALLLLDARTGAITDANPAATEMIGRPLASCLGQTLAAVGLVTDRARVQAILQAGERAGALHDLLVQIETPHGPIDVELIATGYSAGDQAVVLCSLRDITDRTRHDQERQRLLRDLRARVDELSASREYMRHLVRASPAVIYSCEPAPPFKTRFVTENVGRIVGYSADRFVADPSFWAAHIHPDDRAGVEETTAELARTGQVSRDYRYLRADGTVVRLHDEARLIRDASGRPLEVVGYWIEVSGQAAADARRADRDDGARAPGRRGSLTRR